jgi:general secretion pathway protein I
MRPAQRSGFSLMEVLLATAILLGSLIVLGQLATVGRMHANDAAALTTAQLLCQSKLNEILAGASPVQSVERRALPEAPGWVYSVEIESVDKLDMVALRVTVSQAPPDAQEGSELQEPAEGPRPKQFSLTRWIRDPYADTNASDDREPLLAPFDEGFGSEEGGDSEPALMPSFGQGFGGEDLP